MGSVTVGFVAGMLATTPGYPLFLLNLFNNWAEFGAFVRAVAIGLIMAHSANAIRLISSRFIHYIWLFWEDYFFGHFFTS